MKIKPSVAMADAPSLPPIVSSVDSKTAHLNPCSVETTQVPIQLVDGTMGWPTAVSCYELVEESQERVGQMDLLLTRVPSHEDEAELNEVQFPDSTVTLVNPGTSSGILDGAWLQPNGGKLWFYFATAQSSGSIQIHQFKFASFDTSERDHVVDTSLFHHSLVGHSTVPTLGDEDTTDNPPLCLSIRWIPPQYNNMAKISHEIVSTYSSGMVAVHQVIPTSSNASSFAEGESVQVVLVQAWMAHTLFRTTPAEVWSASFAAANQSVVYSGGDDRKLKAWDLRIGCSSPTVTLSDCFDAGVTCISWHPQQENTVAVGSYDEVVRVFDARYLHSRKPLAQSDPLGGVWRIKWHPLSPQRMLVAAMHGGCHVLEFKEGHLVEGTEGSQLQTPFDCKSITRFTEHKSMAYGADWLVSRPKPASAGARYESAVSCSFYDRAVFLWDGSGKQQSARPKQCL